MKKQPCSILRVLRALVVLVALLLAIFCTDSTPAAAQTISEFQPNVVWGGRAIAVTVDPTNTAVAIVASASAGFFKTVDGGSTWRHIEGFPMFRAADVKYAPNSPPGMHVIIATGWRDSRTINGGGIWRSPDGGASWTQPTMVDLPGDQGCFTQASAWGIAFEPGSTNVYVGSSCGLAVSRDLGVTWTRVFLGPSNPMVANVAAQAGGIVDVCGASGHQRSTNGGRTFGPITNGFPGCEGGAIHGVAVSPREATVVFATSSVNLPDGCRGRATALFEGDYASDGTITWTQVSPSMCLGGAGRSSWVATNRSRDRDPHHFDIYFGDGQRLWRQSCTRLGVTGPRCSITDWMRTNGDHDWHDPNGMAFSTANNCPQFVVSDGGIHRPTDAADPTQCGANWRITGGGRGGFNALQIYEVTGAIIEGTPGHTDLFFGTQDNKLFSSADGGLTWPFFQGDEGWRIQVPPTAPDSTLQLVTWAEPSGTYSHYGHFPNGPVTSWRNPPGTVIDNPTLITRDVYVQMSQSSAPGFTVNLTRDTGATWSPVAIIPLGRVPWPQVSLLGNDVTIYQPVDRDGRIGLAKIRSIRRDGTVGTVTVEDADAGELDIGRTDDDFVRKAVYAVDPGDPNHLIAADARRAQMMFSTDGGLTWHVDRQLTALVRGYDPVSGSFELPFGDGRITQVRVIAFDPFYRNHILVGTEAAGIFRSTNDGSSWSRVANSLQVTRITSFFFIHSRRLDPVDAVIVSTFGRGLWRLRLTVPRGVPFDVGEKVANLWGVGVVHQPSTGDVLTLDQFRCQMDPECSPIARWVTVPGGIVRDILLDGIGRVRAVAIDGGRVVASSTDGRPLTLDLTTLTTQQYGKFDGCPGCIKIINKGGVIKGFVLENGKLQAVIATSGQLPGEDQLLKFSPPPPEPPLAPKVTPPTKPYLYLIGTVPVGGQATAFSGDMIMAYGTGFCGDPKCSPVVISVGDRVAVKDLKVDAKGSFKLALAITESSGHYNVTSSQTDAYGKTLTDAKLLIVPVADRSKDH